MKAILETEDLVKYYGEGENQVRAIDHTSMQVQHGEFVAVVGRSGSGKSTLLHMLGGLDRPDTGILYIEGRDIFAVPGNIADGFSDGCNHLIQQGAKLIYQAQDILEEYLYD